MSTQDIITLLGQPDGPKPTLEELNTYKSQKFQENKDKVGVEFIYNHEG